MSGFSRTRVNILSMCLVNYLALLALQSMRKRKLDDLLFVILLCVFCPTLFLFPLDDIVRLCSVTMALP